MTLSSHPQQPKPRQSIHRRNLDCYQDIKVEITIKLILSWILAIGALAALFKLVPYHFSQQAKLREINAQVQETEKRVAKLRAELNRNFDPQQSQNLMEEYSPRLAPNQSRIFWLNQDKE